MNTLEPALIEEAALELGIPPAYIEKDWYAVQLLQDIQAWPYEGITAIFTGGTALSKAHQLISAFLKILICVLARI